MTKSSEAIWDLLRVQASRPYKSTGTHLLLISCSTTSSEATLPILPKMLIIKFKAQNRKTKTNTNPDPEPNRYRRRCPDSNAIQ